MRPARVLIVALVVAALFTGCAPEGVRNVTPTEEPSPPTPPGAPQATPEETPEPPTPATPTEPEPPEDAAAAVAWARRDLAARVGAAADAITLVSIEAVEWRDSSLGCPQPGQMYLQVITPGYRFVFAADGTTYEYHAARGADRAVHCADAG